MLAKRVGWGPIAAWAIAVVVLACGGFVRLIADAGTCGDDGTVDYNWGPEAAIRYRHFLDDRLAVFDAGLVVSLDPRSLWWFVFVLLVVLGVGVLSLRRGRGIALSAASALTLLVLLPVMLGTVGFTIYYVLPVAAALVVSLLALSMGRGRAAAARLAATGALLALMVVFTFAWS